MNNYIHYNLWYEITYPFSNFNDEKSVSGTNPYEMSWIILKKNIYGFVLTDEVWKRCNLSRLDCTTACYSSLFHIRVELHLQASLFLCSSLFLNKGSGKELLDYQKILIYIMWEYVFFCFLNGHMWPCDFNPLLAGGWCSCMGILVRSTMDYHKHTSLGKSCSELATKQHYWS